MSRVQQSDILNNVKEYYGKRLTRTEDMDIQICVRTNTDQPATVQRALSLIHSDVTNKYFGCGIVIPEKLEGMNVLDLGSGSGRDCFALSKLVGQDGNVVGIDMTDEQLAIARKYIDYHMEKFGYDTQNVKFVKGYIEKLSESGIEPESMDIIVSNCVVCLSPDKRTVLKEAYKALKVGGEMYFSDMYADRTLPDQLKKYEVLWGEGLAGALWWEDFYKIAEEVGFSVPRLVTASPIPVNREDFRNLIGDTKYVSITYRLFKLPEEYSVPTEAVYKGDIAGSEEVLDFDHQIKFKKGDLKIVDSEMATILQNSRFHTKFDLKPVNGSVPSETYHCPPNSSKVDPFTFNGTKCSDKKTICPV